MGLKNWVSGMLRANGKVLATQPLGLVLSSSFSVYFGYQSSLTASAAKNQRLIWHLPTDYQILLVQTLILPFLLHF